MTEILVDNVKWYGIFIHQSCNINHTKDVPGTVKTSTLIAPASPKRDSEPLVNAPKTSAMTKRKKTVHVKIRIRWFIFDLDFVNCSTGEDEALSPPSHSTNTSLVSTCESSGLSVKADVIFLQMWGKVPKIEKYLRTFIKFYGVEDGVQQREMKRHQSPFPASVLSEEANITSPAKQQDSDQSSIWGIIWVRRWIHTYLITVTLFQKMCTFFWWSHQ